MESLLKKKVSRKDFLKICAVISAGVVSSFSGFGIFKSLEKRSSKGYGSGAYGG